MEIKNCYLCGCDKARIIHRGVRGGEADVLKCEQCGLVRLNNALDDVDEFYEESGMRHNQTLDLRKIRIISRNDDERRFKFTENMIERKSVIDFGCGDGGYLSLAQNIAEKVAGVELESPMREALNAEGIKCVDSIDKLDKADIITLFHVLEHLQNPLEYLEKFRSHLNDDGMIIVEVPNADDALLSMYKSEAFADYTYWICHIYLYTMKTLALLADKSGYEIVFMRQVQRYPLANHLYWLSNKKPGGHYRWSFLEDDLLDKQYASVLERLGIADTIIAGLRPKN